ncbi:hypothetical protein IAR50_001012 [Cryptococcus sp. DSM 104548]
MALPHPPPQMNFHGQIQAPYHNQPPQSTPQHLQQSPHPQSQAQLQNQQQQQQIQFQQQYALARPPQAQMAMGGMAMNQQQQQQALQAAQQAQQMQQMQMRQQQQQLQAQAQAHAQAQAQHQAGQLPNQPHPISQSPHHPTPSPHLNNQFPPAPHYTHQPGQPMAGVPMGQMSPRSAAARSMPNVPQGAAMAPTQAKGMNRPPAWMQNAMAGPSQQPQPQQGPPPPQHQHPQQVQGAAGPHQRPHPHLPPTPQPQPQSTPQMAGQPHPLQQQGPGQQPMQQMGGHPDYRVGTGGMGLAPTMSRGASGHNQNAPERWDSDRTLKLYIHDYLVKHNLMATASQLAAEAGLGDTGVPVDSREGGVLSEWWTLFLEAFTNGKGVQGVLNQTIYNESMGKLRTIRQQQAGLAPAAYINQPTQTPILQSIQAVFTPQQLEALKQEAQSQGFDNRQTTQFIQQRIQEYQSQLQQQQNQQAMNQQAAMLQQRMGHPGAIGSPVPGARPQSQQGQQLQGQQTMYHPQPQQHLGIPPGARTSSHSPVNPSPHIPHQPHPGGMPTPSPVQQPARNPMNGLVMNGQMRTAPNPHPGRPGQGDEPSQFAHPSQVSTPMHQHPPSQGQLQQVHPSHQHTPLSQHQPPHMTPQNQHLAAKGQQAHVAQQHAQESLTQIQMQAHAQVQAQTQARTQQQQQQMQSQQVQQAQQAQQQREQALQIQQQHLQNASNQLWEGLGVPNVNHGVMAHSAQNLGLSSKDVKSMSDDEKGRLTQTYRMTMQHHQHQAMLNAQHQGPQQPQSQQHLQQQQQQQAYLMQQHQQQQMYQQGQVGPRQARGQPFEPPQPPEDKSAPTPTGSNQRAPTPVQPNMTPSSVRQPTPPERKRKRKNSEGAAPSPFGMTYGPGSQQGTTPGATPLTPGFAITTDPMLRSVPGTAPPQHPTASPRHTTKRERRNQTQGQGEMLPPRTATPKPSGSGVPDESQKDAREGKEGKKEGKGSKAGRTPKLSKEEIQREEQTPKSLNPSPNGNIITVTDGNPHSSSTHGFTPSPPSASTATPANGVMPLSSTPASNHMSLPADLSMANMDFGNMGLGNMGLGGMGMEFAMGMGLGALGGINDNTVGLGAVNNNQTPLGGDVNGDLDAFAGMNQDFDFGLYLAALDEEDGSGNNNTNNNNNNNNSNNNTGGNGELVV